MCASRPSSTMSEAAAHPHNVARGTFVEHDGRMQPAPAPRFSRTAGAIAGPAPRAGEHTREILGDWGIDAGAHRCARGERGGRAALNWAPIVTWAPCVTNP